MSSCTRRTTRRRSPRFTAAVESGEIPQAQIDASVERILRAKARAGLHRVRAVNLDAVSNIVGTRANQAIADEVSQRRSRSSRTSATRCR